MARRNYSNVAQPAYLRTAMTTTTTSINVANTAGGATAAPTGWPAAPHFAVIDHGTATEEVVLVTASSGGTLTVTRGSSFGSVDHTHALDAPLLHAAVAADFDEANAHVNASSGVHGLTGAVVGTTDTQTLSNKTFSGNLSATGTISGTNLPAGVDLSGLDTAWIPFTLTAEGGSGVTFGNATQTCKYQLIGDRLVAFRITLALGSTSEVTGPVALGPLPFVTPGTASNLQAQMAAASCYRSTSAAYPAVAAIWVDNVARVYVGSSVITATHPFDWTAGDLIRISGVLELV